jgi:Skp family chaperone for outer membrane proteins
MTETYGWQNDILLHNRNQISEESKVWCQIAENENNRQQEIRLAVEKIAKAKGISLVLDIRRVWTGTDELKKNGIYIVIPDKPNSEELKKQSTNDLQIQNTSASTNSVVSPSAKLKTFNLPIKLAYFNRNDAFLAIPGLEIPSGIGMGGTIRSVIIEVFQGILEMERNNIKVRQKMSIDDRFNYIQNISQSHYQSLQDRIQELKAECKKTIDTYSSYYDIVVEDNGILYSADSLHLESSTQNITKLLFSKTDYNKEHIEVSVKPSQPIVVSLGYVDMPLLMNKYFPRTSIDKIRQEVHGPDNDKYTPIYQSILLLDSEVDDREELKYEALKVRKDVPSEKRKEIEAKFLEKSANIQKICDCIKQVAQANGITLVLDPTKVWLGDELLTKNGVNLTTMVENRLKNNVDTR